VAVTSAGVPCSFPSSAQCSLMRGDYGNDSVEEILWGPSQTRAQALILNAGVSSLLQRVRASSFEYTTFDVACIHVSQTIYAVIATFEASRLGAQVVLVLVVSLARSAVPSQNQIFVWVCAHWLHSLRSRVCCSWD